MIELIIVSIISLILVNITIATFVFYATSHNISKGWRTAKWDVKLAVMAICAVGFVFFAPVYYYSRKKKKGR